jgi:hypothetical protein
MSYSYHTRGQVRVQVLEGGERNLEFLHQWCSIKLSSWSGCGMARIPACAASLVLESAREQRCRSMTTTRSSLAIIDSMTQQMTRRADNKQPLLFHTTWRSRGCASRHFLQLPYLALVARITAYVCNGYLYGTSPLLSLSQHAEDWSTTLLLVLCFSPSAARTLPPACVLLIRDTGTWVDFAPSSERMLQKIINLNPKLYAIIRAVDFSQHFWRIICL